MSVENVEIVRAICDAFTRGDYEAAFERIDEDIEFFGPPDVTAAGRLWRGHDGVRQAMASFTGTFADYHFEARNLIDCGDEVFVEAWQSGRGRGSGVEVSESIYSVWNVRGAKAVRQRMFRDRADAAEAAGLSE